MGKKKPLDTTYSLKEQDFTSPYRKTSRKTSTKTKMKPERKRRRNITKWREKKFLGPYMFPSRTTLWEDPLLFFKISAHGKPHRAQDRLVHRPTMHAEENE